jgi:hypothetical protein
MPKRPYTKTEKSKDRLRYERNIERRRQQSREYYWKHKKKIRAYQDKAWQTQEGWAVIIRAKKRYLLRKKGVNEAEIKKIVDAMPMKQMTRKGKPLKPMVYKHRSKYSGKGK